MKKKFIIFLTFFSLIIFPNIALSELLLFSDDDVFLGCLDCSIYASGSICNKYGEHGNKYNSNSIWNKYGTYGSEYNSNSPWNSYSSSGPKIVDRNGNYFGRFSINIYSGFEQSSILEEIYESYDGDLDNVRDAFCDALN